MFEPRKTASLHPLPIGAHGEEHTDPWHRPLPAQSEPAATDTTHDPSASAHPAADVAADPGAAARLMAHYGDDAESAPAPQPELEAPQPDASEEPAHEPPSAEAPGEAAAEGGEAPQRSEQDPAEAAGAHEAQEEAGAQSAESAEDATAPALAPEESKDASEDADEHAAEQEDHEGGHAAEHKEAHGEEVEEDHAALIGGGGAGSGTARRSQLRSLRAPAPATFASAAPARSGATARAASTSASPSRSRSVYAQVDRYNRTLASNPYTDKKNQLQRPGIRYGGKDKFKVKGGAQVRYLITDGDQVKVADRVKNQNSKGQPNDIAVNIAHTRKLVLHPGKKPVECVLVFVRGRGSAWMPIDGLAVDKSTLRNKVNAKAEKHAPARAPKGAKFARYTFRSTVPEAKIDDDYIQPNRTNGADMVEHYLQRQVKTGLKKSEGPSERTYYNLSLNLPQKKAPPTAVDAAEPGAPFFAVEGKSFERQVSVFGEKKKDPKSSFAWVFGYLGKKQGNKWVPDEKRRGWIPKRCLRAGE